MHSAFIVILISLLCKKKVMQLNFLSRSVLPGGIMGEGVWCMWQYLQSNAIPTIHFPIEYMQNQNNWRQWDGSAGKGACCQGWLPKFHPWNLHGEWKESSSTCDLVISICHSQNPTTWSKSHPRPIFKRIDEVHIYCCFDVIWKVIILPGLIEIQVVPYVN